MLFKNQRRYVFAVLLLPLALGGLPVRVASAAAASTPATDVVNLKNGGMVRGQIVELLPDDSLTVVSAATGETTRYTWAELASFERAGTTTDVSAVDAGPRFGALQATAGAPRLHIELTRPADLKLFEVTGTISMMNFKTGFSSGETYRPVCVAPCDQVIDGRRGQSFFFNGDGCRGAAVTSWRGSSQGGRGCAWAASSSCLTGAWPSAPRRCCSCSRIAAFAGTTTWASRCRASPTTCRQPRS